MNKTNTAILIIAGAAAPGSVAYWHLPDAARLAAYAFVLALVCVVALYYEPVADVQERTQPQLPSAPIERIEYQPMSVVTTRLDLPEAYTGVTERLEN